MSELVLAIDPGPTESAYVLWDGERILGHGKAENFKITDAIHVGIPDFDTLVIEKIASYGMPVGEEVFETVFWSGRFAEAATIRMKALMRITRGQVKSHICHSSRSNDANIRQALIDRWGGPAAVKAYRKANPKKAISERPAGALLGITADQWAALAVAVTFTDKRKAGEL
jgi:hypothetical protein